MEIIPELMVHRKLPPFKLPPPETKISIRRLFFRDKQLANNNNNNNNSTRNNNNNNNNNNNPSNIRPFFLNGGGGFGGEAARRAKTRQGLPRCWETASFHQARIPSGSVHDGGWQQHLPFQWVMLSHAPNLPSVNGIRGTFLISDLGWWVVFSTFYFYFICLPWYFRGNMIQFDLRIFRKWVGKNHQKLELRIEAKPLRCWKPPEKNTISHQHSVIIPTCWVRSLWVPVWCSQVVLVQPFGIVTWGLKCSWWSKSIVPEFIKWA